MAQSYLPYNGPGYPDISAINTSVQTGLAGLVQAQTASRALELEAVSARSAEVREERKFDLDLQTTLLAAAKERRQEERDASENLIKLQSLQLEKQQSDLKLKEAQFNLDVKMRSSSFEENNGAKYAEIMAMANPVSRELAWRSLQSRPGSSFMPAKWLEARERDAGIAATKSVILPDGATVSVATAADHITSGVPSLRTLGFAVSKSLGGDPRTLPGYSDSLAYDVNEQSRGMTPYSADTAPLILNQIDAVSDLEALSALESRLAKNVTDPEELEDISEDYRVKRIKLSAAVNLGYQNLASAGITKAQFEQTYMQAPRPAGDKATTRINSAVVAGVSRTTEVLNSRVASGDLTESEAEAYAEQSGTLYRTLDDIGRKLPSGSDYYSLDTANVVVNELTPALMDASIAGDLGGVNAPGHLIGEDEAVVSSQVVDLATYNKKITDAIADKEEGVSRDQLKFAGPGKSKPVLSFSEAQAQISNYDRNPPKEGTLAYQHREYLMREAGIFLVPSASGTGMITPEAAVIDAKQKGIAVQTTAVRNLSAPIMDEFFRVRSPAELRGRFARGLTGVDPGKNMTGKNAAAEARTRAKYFIRTAEYAGDRFPMMPGRFVSSSDYVVLGMGDATSLARGATTQNPILGGALRVVEFPWTSMVAVFEAARGGLPLLDTLAVADPQENREEPHVAYGEYKVLSVSTGASISSGLGQRVVRAANGSKQTSEVAKNLVQWQGAVEAAEEQANKFNISDTRGVALGLGTYSTEEVRTLATLYHSEFSGSESSDLATEIMALGGDFKLIKSYLSRFSNRGEGLVGSTNRKKRAEEDSKIFSNLGSPSPTVLDVPEPTGLKGTP